MATHSPRWTLIIGGGLIVLLLAGFLAFQFSLYALKEQVQKALGPQGEMQDIRVSLTGVEIIGIKIKTPFTESGSASAWPAVDQLRAERILLVPSFFDLLSARITLQTVRIEGVYIAMLRTKDDQIKVLPDLFETHTSVAPSENRPSSEKIPSITISKIELVNGTIEFFDASIRTPAHKLRLEQIYAGIDKIKFPGFEGFSNINLIGVIKGVQQDGKISMAGTVEFANKELGISTRLRGVDLMVLQPYLIKTNESVVTKGVLDLDLNSSIQKGKLRAPGTLTLKNLELASTSGTIMGLPRSAVLAVMKKRDGNFSLKFVLEGDINAPRFSLNESFTTSIGSAFAKSVSVNFNESLGNLIK